MQGFLALNQIIFWVCRLLLENKASLFYPLCIISFLDNLGKASLFYPLCIISFLDNLGQASLFYPLCIISFLDNLGKASLPTWLSAVCLFFVCVPPPLTWDKASLSPKLFADISFGTGLPSTFFCLRWLLYLLTGQLRQISEQ